MTAIATFDVTVLDTPEPKRLAEFYAALLDWKIEDQSDDWIPLRGRGGHGLAFQLAPDYVAPSWPTNEVPQQVHLDFDVPDLDAAESQVLALGATATGLPEKPASFRVYLDPTGHPFCLCKGA